jgi:hypothetical protein
MAVSPSFLHSPMVSIDRYGMAAGLLMDQTIFLVWPRAPFAHFNWHLIG